jgi:hypothetical protein
MDEDKRASSDVEVVDQSVVVKKQTPIHTLDRPRRKVLLLARKVL